MKVKIAGIHGYLGHIISEELRKKGHVVSGIDRALLYGNTALLQEDIKSCDVLINIAGAPILQYWTRRNKERIYNSRVRVTQHIVKAINGLSLDERPKRFIQTSAVGIYTAGTLHSELSTTFAPSFLGKLVQDWEAALETLHYSVEKTVFRLGLVIGKESQIIKRLVPLFRLGLGAKIGNGTQPFPFIHEHDLCRAYIMACEGKLPLATYNLVAPEDISNKDFTLALARQVKKKALFSVPPLALKLQLGKASQVLLESPQANPQKLIKAGFEFKFPIISEALENITSTTKKRAAVD